MADDEIKPNAGGCASSCVDPYTSEAVKPGMNRRLRAVPLLVLAAATLAVAACENTGPAEAPAASGPAAAPAAAAAQVGAADSGCALPVTFGIAASWKPKAVQVRKDDPLAALAQRGALTMACEIDAKPADNIGFLRVWTGAAGELRPALTGFIGQQAQAPSFTELTIGGRPALEVVYQERSQPDDTLEQERAFIVQTGKGLVAVSLDAFDDGEHDAMLPAYELAKSSLTVTG
jgi:hypothetical protein